MSESEIVQVQTENPVPSVLTTDLKTILSFYKEKIIELGARGGDTPGSVVELIPDYGVSFNPGSSESISINYLQKRTKDGKIENPMDKNAIRNIYKSINDNLSKREEQQPTIPVQRFAVEIEDNMIQKLEKRETNTFDITFKSDPPEPNMRKRVLKPDSEYYDEELGDHWEILLNFGFKIRNLNCVELLETSERFGKLKAERRPIIQWKGYKSQQIPKSPIAVASIIKKKYLPPEPFGMLKTYILTQTNQLILDGVR